MKKLISLCLSFILVLSLFSGCGKTNSADSDKLSIVTTIFPVYDWVMQLLGDQAVNADVDMLLDNGVDLHSYQPTADDIIHISTCDLFIYVGGNSDQWVDDALKEAVNKDMVAINLMDVLGDKVQEEELVEGMQGEEEEEEEGPEYDEHIWLSIRNAQILCNAIGNALAQIDADHSDTYSANLDAYTQKLSQLDQEYQNAVDAASYDTLLFGDRFPFRYLVDDYGLSYYAAFVGCSAESEASFETISFLSSKVDELGLHTVMTLEGSDRRIAETIIASTQSQSAQIQTMDSMQSTTAQNVADGAAYLSVMEKNLEALKAALA